uniref:Uncharacterized protein n=1 Tax=Anopheles coluzzii TaxID=1518534 RepID=A0A8W7PJ08_ANOCL
MYCLADLSYTRDTGTFAREQIERDRVPAPPLPPVLSAVAVEGFRRGEGNCGHSFPCTVDGRRGRCGWTIVVRQSEQQAHDRTVAPVQHGRTGSTTSTHSDRERPLARSRLGRIALSAIGPGLAPVQLAVPPRTGPFVDVLTGSPGCTPSRAYAHLRMARSGDRTRDRFRAA